MRAASASRPAARRRAARRRLMPLNAGFGLAAIGTLIVHVRLAFVGQKERRLAIARNSAMEIVDAQHVRRPEIERGGHINARLGVVKDDLFPPRRQSEITEVTAVKQA